MKIIIIIIIIICKLLYCRTSLLPGDACLQLNNTTQVNY
jgi:hypothetical protein